MNPIKVLEISVRADIGGGPKHLLDLSSALNPSKIEVISAVPTEGELSKLIIGASKKSIALPFRRFSLLSLVSLLVFCKKEGIQILHSHGRGAGIYSRALKPFGFKVIHTFHGVHIGEGFKGKAVLAVEKLLSFFTDSFICVSESEKSLAIVNKVAREDKVRVIFNGVRILDNQNDCTKNTEILNIGTLSRLDKVKGLDILIDYITRFVEEEDLDALPKFQVYIAGDGEEKDNLKKKIPNSRGDLIKFIGPTSDPLKFLETLDIYVSFSYREGMPLAVLEAMSKEVPCLLSNVEGNNDLISNNQNGLLFSLLEYEDFKLKLKKFLLYPEKRKQLGKKGFMSVKENFNIELMAKKTEQVYLSHI